MPTHGILIVEAPSAFDSVCLQLYATAYGPEHGGGAQTAAHWQMRSSLQRPLRGHLRVRTLTGCSVCATVSADLNGLVITVK
jgi:hypothetical protein